MREASHHGSGGSAATNSCVHEVQLLGGFQLRCQGEVVEVRRSSQRIIAFLSLNDRSLPRPYVAATLWPDTTDAKACANLRTALWRLHSPQHHIVHVDSSRVALGPDVRVDVREVDAAARHYRSTGTIPGREVVDRARGELLPGFWDSWLLFERERLRHEIVHLHELVCSDALSRGEVHLAVVAALAAVDCDPLRESSTAWLIKAHLAGGNRSDALRTFQRYAALLDHDLGVPPNPELVSLVVGATEMARPASTIAPISAEVARRRQAVRRHATT